MKSIVIGIVVTVVGGLILLNLEYKFFNEGSKSNDNGVLSEVISRYVNKNKRRSIQKYTVNIDDNVNIYAGININIPIKYNGLVELHATANKISDNYTKANELDKLCELARSKGEYSYSINLAKDIPDSYRKDNALENIIEDTTKLKLYNIAILATEFISDSYRKDQNLKKILSIRQKNI